MQIYDFFEICKFFRPRVGVCGGVRGEAAAGGWARGEGSGRRAWGVRGGVFHMEH